MISFSLLGHYGRLGNQLFQYAYLRTSARRLETTFYCPTWDGDAMFDLADQDERASQPEGIVHRFDSHPQAGFTPRALEIGDHTDVRGFFQSERYYRDPAEVRRWFAFKEAIRAKVHERYADDVLRDVVSLSLRIDQDYAATRGYFPLYPLSYYRKGLEAIGARGPILVFADRPDLAREFFAPLRGDVRFVTELGAAEQLYLMSRCRGNVITNSTFAWWGAWLNAREDRTVVAPNSWCRPGIRIPIDDILCEDWVKVRGTVPVWDSFQCWRLRHPVATIRRVWERVVRPRTESASVANASSDERALPLQDETAR